MNIPLTVTFHGIPPSPALEAAVRTRVEHVQRFFGRVTACAVTIDAPHRHHHTGKPFVVHVRLDVPGRTIVVSGSHHAESHADPYTALHDAFDAARRQLQDYARRRRGDVKAHEPPPGSASAAQK